MKKKIVFAVATGFFAVATVFNMNLLQSNKAGDVSLDAIAVMAQAQKEVEEDKEEEDIYHKGTTGTNWKTYTVECVLGPSVSETKGSYGGSYSSSFGASVPIPGTPVSVSATRSTSAYYYKQTTNYQIIPPKTIKKDVCGSGVGFCLESAPKSGNPCS
jgi:hypothetical protein